MKDKVHITVSFSRDVAQRITEVAHDGGKTIPQVIREAVSKHIPWRQRDSLSNHTPTSPDWTPTYER